MQMSVSLERLARNQTLFREVNERLLTLSNGPRSDRIDFLCECSRVECAETIPLTLEEYNEVRSDPKTFAVVPGHETLEVEDVVGTKSRFVVVRKKNGSSFAIETDPRARATVNQ
jgi:hypothetical protein